MFQKEKLEELAELFGMPYLLNNVYEENVKMLRQLNKKLYEQFEKI